MISFPRRHLATLEELAAEVLERRGATGQPEALARDLLSGFFEQCLRLGLDGVLVALTPGELLDETALSEEPRFRDALTARLASRDNFDPGGPRAAMPRQLADCLVASLSLTLHDPPDRAIAVPDAVRSEVVAVMSSAVDEALAVPQVRDAIIATGRALCNPQYLEAFDEIAPRLDERGTSFPPQPRMPLHALQEVKQVLFAAKTEVLERAAQDAIDRASAVLARASADAAARLDQPISHRWTPREVAIGRLGELRILRPEEVVQSLVASLSELAELAWEPPAPSSRPYSPRATFAVGDLLDHPTFGNGTVEASSESSIEVEFEDGTWRTLVHARSP
jgi:hypothetical protein